MSFGNSGDSRPASSSPYASGPQQPVAPKSKALWWILGIIGFLTVGGAVVCCGVGYYAFRFGTQIVGEAIKGSIANDAAIQEHIGTISTIEVNIAATKAAGGGKKIVFDVSGDKGTGQLQVVMDNGEGEQAIKSCLLILPNGEKHEVKVDTETLEITPGEVVPEDVPIGDAATTTESTHTEPSIEPSIEEDAAKLESDLLNTPEPATN